MGSPIAPISSAKMFGGFNRRYKHSSTSCCCDMIFQIFFPPQAEAGAVPVVYYLSGLTCTDENGIQKSGAQRKAAELGVALVCPDTSPRGLNIPGEAEAWDFGIGAGFYLNATEQPWGAWRMYDYVVKELPDYIKQNFDNLDVSRASIMGHSMGGHGALTIGLKNPEQYRSISAFSPICNPMRVPWGQKAFRGYLGADEAAWKPYDACELVVQYTGPVRRILVDTGSSDPFLERELKPDSFAAAAAGRPVELNMRLQDGYDHSYFFISTFMDEHIAFHAAALQS